MNSSDSCSVATPGRSGFADVLQMFSRGATCARTFTPANAAESRAIVSSRIAPCIAAVAVGAPDLRLRRVHRPAVGRVAGQAARALARDLVVGLRVRHAGLLRRQRRPERRPRPTPRARGRCDDSGSSSGGSCEHVSSRSVRTANGATSVCGVRMFLESRRRREHRGAGGDHDVVVQPRAILHAGAGVDADRAIDVAAETGSPTGPRCAGTAGR